MSGIRKPPALSIVTLFSVQMSSFPETAESDGLRDVAPGIESAVTFLSGPDYGNRTLTHIRLISFRWGADLGLRHTAGDDR